MDKHIQQQEHLLEYNRNKIELKLAQMVLEIWTFSLQLKKDKWKIIKKFKIMLMTEKNRQIQMRIVNKKT